MLGSSHYANYLSERTTDFIMEDSNGFVTYRFLNDGKSVYIIDIYVIPDMRKQGLASDFADIVVSMAKARGCEEVLGTVVPSSKGSNESLRVLLAYGMELKSSAHDIIIFRKGI